MKTKWKKIKVITSGDRLEINGLNIWDYEWRYTGKIVTIKDPIYKKFHKGIVYEISDGDLKVIFAAAEFSNSIFGIYIEKKSWF